MTSSTSTNDKTHGRSQTLTQETSNAKNSNDMAGRSVAVVGLGSMGSGMATALLKAGWHVRGYDPAPEAAREASQLGVEIAVSPAEAAAACEFLLLSLPSAEVVRRACEDLTSAQGLEVVLDTTTSEPSTSRDLAEALAPRGVAFVDAPVSGGRTGAAAGQLMAFVGGSEANVEKAAPLLDVLARDRWRRMGEAGAGNVVKLINNALAATHLVVAAEAVEMATAYGLEPEVVLTALNAASGRSGATEINYPKWILPGSYDSGFALGLMARDIRLAVEAAARAGLSPTMLAVGADAWADALSEHGPEADFNRATLSFGRGRSQPALLSETHQGGAAR